MLLAPKRANDQALSQLLGKIDISAMRETNLRAAGGDGASSPDAVARWLWEKIALTRARFAIRVGSHRHWGGRLDTPYTR